MLLFGKRNKLTELEQLSLYGIDPNKGNILFEDYAEIFLRKKLSSSKTPSAHKNHEQRLRLHILPLVGSIPLKNIRKSHGEEIQFNLRDKHNNKGINLIISTFKGIMLEAERDEYIVRTPLKNLKDYPETQSEDKFWTIEEINQFLRANQSDPNYHLYYLAIYTGMRKGELAALKWEAVSFQQEKIFVRATSDRYGHRESTKTGKNRQIPMKGHLFHFMLNLHNQKKSEFVFTDKNSEQLNTHHLYRDFCKAQSNAKMQNIIRFHDLRHTFASNFVMIGGSIFELQKILGHSKIDMTMRYTHHSPEYLSKSSQFMDFGLENLVSLNNPTHILPTAVKNDDVDEDVVSVNL